MNKNDIAKTLSSLLGSKKEADAAVDKVFKEMSKALKNGHNPKTGEKLMIPPMKKIRFK